MTYTNFLINSQKFLYSIFYSKQTSSILSISYDTIFTNDRTIFTFSAQILMRNIKHTNPYKLTKKQHRNETQIQKKPDQI